MLVYKFGGASVKDAYSIRSLLPLIEKQRSEKLLVVISAMGKMTNAFEHLLTLYREDNPMKLNQLNKIKTYHLSIISDLFEINHPVFQLVNNCFLQLEEKLAEASKQSYDYSYDQTVVFGELLSTRIVSEFFNQNKVDNILLDASDLLITNAKYRDARLDWEKTKEKISVKLTPQFEKASIVITQGFIGGTEAGRRTTLSREGSDYSAAIFAHFLNAEKLVVWKDVPGILNGDPKYFSKARSLKHISYHETVELAFYGASVIHPRTLQPLKAKQIPLFVRSFKNPDSETVINSNNTDDGDIPSFIIKENQILFSIASRDFSFIDAEKLTEILKLFSSNHFYIRLLQNSALNFSIVADENTLQLEELLKQLQKEYSVKYNRNLSLLTVRHWNDDRLNNLFTDIELLLEMHNRLTDQFVMKAQDLSRKLEGLLFIV
ncbi:MAG: aspartate kinase [Bacteroidales bacterium]|nr:aspartate kinase [Bacteroidales bacterium]